MQNELALFGGRKVTEDTGPHFVWPRITEATKAAVMKQMDASVSIYDRSGVFKDFETEFAEYHGMQYALLSNSGTNAIFSMFEGIGLGPEDEIISPTYTFFATISPVVYTGAKPVFCDSTATGNIDPSEIRRKITPKTRAVIVTHMWGVPCDMDEIVAICKEHNLFLLEDCSHAHGATYKGKTVGSFGDAAAWSLQGQKIVTGGEGGIMLTNNPDIYYRATLQGHYNKRCKQEIPADNPLAAFSTTGFGLKFRAHPMAIAMADEQFGHLAAWLSQKREFAAKMIDSLREFPFLSFPEFQDRKPSWYAFVMQFVPEKANGVTIDQFVEALMAEGLKEVDRPGSTSPVHNLALFTKTVQAMPRLYREYLPNEPQEFPRAQNFWVNAIKLPVWAFPDEEKWVDVYIDGFRKVGKVLMEKPSIFK